MASIKHIAISALFIAVFAPSVAMAQGLTNSQASAVLALLEAFGVDKTTLVEVRELLMPVGAASVAPVKEPEAKMCDPKGMYVPQKEKDRCNVCAVGEWVYYNKGHDAKYKCTGFGG